MCIRDSLGTFQQDLAENPDPRILQTFSRGPAKPDRDVDSVVNRTPINSIDNRIYLEFANPVSEAERFVKESCSVDDR